MKRLLATAALVVAGALAVPAPAYAGPSGNFTHVSPDEGYDGAFRVTCYQTGIQYMLYEGQSSHCTNGVSSIYVFPGSEVWCRYRSVQGDWIWFKAFDATGSWSTANVISTQCVTHAD